MPYISIKITEQEKVEFRDRAIREGVNEATLARKLLGLNAAKPNAWQASAKKRLTNPRS